jgi:hypothetical protein
LNNLFGLAKKLLSAKNPAGRSAMLYSFLGLVMIPFDAVMAFFERQLHKVGDKPKLPLLFVCGPPRSGTTLVEQVLIKYLPVYYFNNLTSIFPNAPIISNKIFGRLIEKSNKDVSFKSLYGRTTGLGAPNDALYLWDRWTDVNRATIPKQISQKNQARMQRFFYAVEEFSGKPLLNKNNALNTYANHVADALETAYFICLDRNPVFLAQSQLLASKFIHGDENIPYGVHFNQGAASAREQNSDAVKQVCEQVMAHKEMMLKQRKLIGDERFIVVPYEDFCKDPAKWVNRISDQILKQPLDLQLLRKELKPFKISNDVKIGADIFKKIESLLTSQSAQTDTKYE